MTKRQFHWAITIFVGSVIIIGGAGLLIWQAFWPQIQQMSFGSNNRVVPFHEHHRLDPEAPSLILDRGLAQEFPEPFIRDEVIYLPMVFLQTNFDQFMFWDNGASILFVTTREDILEFSLNETHFYLNGQRQTMEQPIRRVGGEIFVPATLAEALYPLRVEHYTQYNLIVVDNISQPRTTAQLNRRADIRYRELASAPIAVRAASGSTVIVFEENGDFTRVRDENGILGWVQTTALGERETYFPLETLEREPLLASFIDNEIHHLPNWPAGKSVVMAWDSIYVQAANANMMANPLDESLTVIAPMWFRLDEETMGITSLACMEYVQWAQAQGVQVWPFVFDVFYSHSHAILTNREARQRVIDTLIGYVDELGLDGINIGFEHIRPADGVYLIQFLRELAPQLRQRGVVLSKNVLVPRPYTQFYRRDLMAYTLDFIIIMAYDEHWSNAPNSGPVASLPFVQRSIEDSLPQIPREQLVLGVPFYNRIWREVIGDNRVETRTTRHHGTGYTRAWFDYNDVEWEWLPDIGKYFAYFAALDDGVPVQYLVWLECERSIALKLQMALGYELAGVSVWNRNFRHNEDLWEVMGQYFGR